MGSNSNAQYCIGCGNSVLESTYLIEVKQDTSVSLKARELRSGGYETAFGNNVNFISWYSPSWYDTKITWITQITSKFGIVWGVSTGEYGEKYNIHPGLSLGFMYQLEPIKSGLITIFTTTTLGGNLSEKTCEADYGEIAGIHQVNCRLAATTMTPQETLNYMVEAKPENIWHIKFQYFFK